MQYGAGEYCYDLVTGWAKSPSGWPFLDASGLFVDAEDNVYILCRGPHPVMVFDRNGKFLRGFGEGAFNRPHSIWVGPDGAVYCTDDHDRKLLKFGADGTLLMTRKDFARPNGVSLSSRGDIYVSDGEIFRKKGGSERVLRLSPDGAVLISWGEGGERPGQFEFPHSVWVDQNDFAWVGDRENNRIQIFDERGEFVRQISDLLRPNAVALDRLGNVYVAEHPQRVSIFSNDGRLLARWGSTGQDMKTALFSTPHSIAVDSRGDIYVGENRHALAKDDGPVRAVQKFVRKQ
jgi:sugar lactone lactonase YvrE